MMATCTWCPNPATTTVEVEPAIYERKALVEAAVIAPACAQHSHILANQPPPSAVTFRNHRRRKARGIDQLDIFGGGTAAPANAIDNSR